MPPAAPAPGWRRDSDVPAADLEAMRQGVRLQALQQTQGSDARAVAVAVYGGAHRDQLLGGAWGRTEFQRLYIEGLWLGEGADEGLAGDCLRQIEALALQRGCVDALVETLSDEQAERYERLGYVCVAHLHDFLPGFIRHTLLKVWAPRA